MNNHQMFTCISYSSTVKLRVFRKNNVINLLSFLFSNLLIQIQPASLDHEKGAYDISKGQELQIGAMCPGWILVFSPQLNYIIFYSYFLIIFTPTYFNQIHSALENTFCIIVLFQKEKL